MNEEQEDTILYAFNELVDTTIDELSERGLTEREALDTVFTVATDLAEHELLPNFPDDQVPVEAVGEWFLAATEFGFIRFCVEAVGE